MKCIQYYPKFIKDGVQYARVSDEEAANAVASLKAAYAPKRLWKQHVRDAVA